MNKFGIVNIFLVFFLTVSLICISLFSVINKNFKDAPSILSFFENANVYGNVSNIVRLEIESMYPGPIKRNIILAGFADKLLDIVITPATVKKVAKPAVGLAVKFAQSPTSIIDNKVVVATAKYKEQAIIALTDFGLPKLLLINARFLVDSIPANLTIVNLEKRPNSVLGLIIKARTALQYSRTITNISWVVFWVSLLLIFANNIYRVRDMVKVLWVGLGTAGGVIVLFYLFLNSILSMVLPITSDAITIAQNTLVIDVSNTRKSEAESIANSLRERNRVASLIFSRAIKERWILMAFSISPLERKSPPRAK